MVVKVDWNSFLTILTIPAACSLGSTEGALEIPLSARNTIAHISITELVDKYFVAYLHMLI